jgi:hypothetical protein
LAFLAIEALYDWILKIPFREKMDWKQLTPYVALAVPSTVALVAFVRARAGWRQWIGPGVFLAFIALMVVVEYVWVVEFRSPMRYDILVPYLVLFFGSIKFYKARSTFNYQKISLEIPLHFQTKRISLRVFTQKGE